MHLKLQKVTTLYKKCDKTDLNNYRPISILPTISKVFEQVIIHVQLYDYFCKKKTIYYVNNSAVLAQNICKL